MGKPISAYIDDVISTANKYRPSDAERLHPVNVAMWIAQYRGSLMAKHTDFGKVNLDLFQIPFGTLTLTKAANGSYWTKLPTAPILFSEAGGNPRGMTVTIDDDLTPVTLRTAATAFFAMTAEFRDTIAWLRNARYLHVAAKSGQPTKINVWAIPADPMDATYDYQTDSLRAYNRFTDDYPITEEMAEEITDMILVKKLGLIQKIVPVPDMANDGTSTTN